MIFDLPTSLEFGGREWNINTDYRDILTIIEAFEDNELNEQEKAFVCLHNLYCEFEDIPNNLYQAAYEKAVEFIDVGSKDQSRSQIRTMDWEQDAPIIFPAINHVAGYEVRSAKYLHWWTFIGMFMEIKDSTCATVFSLRQKKARGKKLEKYEKEYWAQNKELCVLRPKETEEDKVEKARLEAILGKRKT